MIEQKQLMSTLQTSSMLTHLPCLMMTWYAIDEGLLPCVMGLVCCVFFLSVGHLYVCIGCNLFFVCCKWVSAGGKPSDWDMMSCEPDATTWMCKQM
jgi:hypothetical protein